MQTILPLSTVSSAPDLLAAAQTGASLTAVIMIVKVWVAEVSTPPFVIPPLSWTSRVMVARPLASAAGVNVRVPFEATAGTTEKSPLFVLPVMLKLRTWPDSLAGPVSRAVAQPRTVFAPLSSFTTWLAPLVKEGTSLTAVTSMVTVATLLTPPVPSSAVKVNESDPLKSGLGA